MPTVSNVSKPAYVYDAGTDAWIPVGVGVHTHSDAVQTSNYFVAGKNKIINGDFAINQRNFTSTTTENTFGFDRWVMYKAGGCTYSSQSFTAGSAPVSGYEGANFARLLTSGQTLTTEHAILAQPIEDVRTLAGQTVTISFWAKAASGTPKIAFEWIQSFGSGGSPSASVLTYAGQVTISTSWARYSLTFNSPSLSGKTIGTTANTSAIYLNIWVSAGSSFNSRTGSLGIQNNTFDFWGIQVEAGSVATPFTTATGTLQGELAACQRYYYRQYAAGGGAMVGTLGLALTTSIVDFPVPFQSTLRTIPTAIDHAGMQIYSPVAVTQYNSGTFTLGAGSNVNQGMVRYTHGSGVFTNGWAYFPNGSGNTSYIGFSAEL